MREGVVERQESGETGAVELGVGVVDEQQRLLADGREAAREGDLEQETQRLSLARRGDLARRGPGPADLELVAVRSDRRPTASALLARARASASSRAPSPAVAVSGEGR